MGAARSMVEAFAAMGCPGYAELLARGEEFAGRTPAREIPAAARWARREKPRVKMCYKNATLFCLACPEAKYYEGYWSAHFVPVHHAWVVLDGKVIDFTAEACDRKLTREGVPSDSTGSDYFGVHVPTEDVVRIITEKGTYGVMAEWFTEMESSAAAGE